jgi:hypothetical protein
MSIYGLWLEGWEEQSTWGIDEPLATLYAQLSRNGHSDDYGRPQIWLSPPAHPVIQRSPQLARLIAEATGTALRTVYDAMNAGLDNHGETLWRLPSRKYDAAVVNAITAYRLEVDEATSTGDPTTWPDRVFDGITVTVDSYQWQLRIEEGSWGAIRLTCDAEHGRFVIDPQSSGTVGTIAISSEELLKRLRGRRTGPHRTYDH